MARLNGFLMLPFLARGGVHLAGERLFVTRASVFVNVAAQFRSRAAVFPI